MVVAVESLVDDVTSFLASASRMARVHRQLTVTTRHWRKASTNFRVNVYQMKIIQLVNRETEENSISGFESFFEAGVKNKNLDWE